MELYLQSTRIGKTNPQSVRGTLCDRDVICQESLERQAITFHGQNKMNTRALDHNTPRFLQLPHFIRTILEKQERMSSLCALRTRAAYIGVFIILFPKHDIVPSGNVINVECRHHTLYEFQKLSPRPHTPINFSYNILLAFTNFRVFDNSKNPKCSCVC